MSRPWFIKLGYMILIVGLIYRITNILGIMFVLQELGIRYHSLTLTEASRASQCSFSPSDSVTLRKFRVHIVKCEGTIPEFPDPVNRKQRVRTTETFSTV